MNARSTRKKVPKNELYKGLRGNKNALKGTEPLDSQLHVRTTPAEKIRFIRLAHEQGLKLSEWATNALNKYAEEQEARGEHRDATHIENSGS